MRNLYKITNIALIFTLIGVFLHSGVAYTEDTSLRVPFCLQRKGFERDFRKTALIKKAELAGKESTREKIKAAFQELGAVTLHGHIIINPEGRNWLILGQEMTGKAALAGKLFEEPATYGQWDLLANVEVMAFLIQIIQIYL